MFWLGGEMADRWIDKFPELDVTLPNYRLTDKKNYRLVQFGFNSVVLDIEGDKNIEPFIKLSQTLASDLIEVVNPTSILRIGMRQINLVNTSSARPLADVREAFGPQKEEWNDPEGRDNISDIGIVLNYSSGNFDGQTHFGPYLAGVNNVQNFIYGDHPELRDLRTGMIFNCDYGEKNPERSALEEKNLADWILRASTVSRERIDKVRRVIYPSGE